MKQAIAAAGLSVVSGSWVDTAVILLVTLGSTFEASSQTLCWTLAASSPAGSIGPTPTPTSPSGIPSSLISFFLLPLGRVSTGLGSTASLPSPISAALSPPAILPSGHLPVSRRFSSSRPVVGRVSAVSSSRVPPGSSFSSGIVAVARRRRPALWIVVVGGLSSFSLSFVVITFKPGSRLISVRQQIVIAEDQIVSVVHGIGLGSPELEFRSGLQLICKTAQLIQTTLLISLQHVLAVQLQLLCGSLFHEVMEDSLDRVLRLLPPLLQASRGVLNLQVFAGQALQK